MYVQWLCDWAVWSLSGWPTHGQNVEFGYLAFGGKPLQFWGEVVHLDGYFGLQHGNPVKWATKGTRCYSFSCTPKLPSQHYSSWWFTSRTSASWVAHTFFDRWCGAYTASFGGTARLLQNKATSNFAVAQISNSNLSVLAEKSIGRDN